MPAPTYTPDILGAFVDWLRDSPDVQAAAGGDPPRVSAVLKEEWGAKATTAVVLTYAGGTHEQPVFLRPRLDVRCYGSNFQAASDLWRRVHSYLMAGGFKRAYTLVYGVEMEGGPTSLVDPDSKWPFTLATYRPLVAEWAAA